MTKEEIFTSLKADDFHSIALDTFKKQSRENKVYKKFISLLSIEPSNIKKIEEIPFLPDYFFKSHVVTVYKKKPDEFFISSGTTRDSKSKHYIKDLDWYEQSYSKGFEYFYQDISDYVILALLPNYSYSKNSSLIYMVNGLVYMSKHSESGFYLLDNLEMLYNKLKDLEERKQKTLLIGVPYSLLYFVEHFQINLNYTIIMETGGMKGKHREIIREELHEVLSNGFGLCNSKIHSEYGMTELLSQSYSKGKGIFESPPWMRILIRDARDPFYILPKNRKGCINVIDLANQESCAFIATQDIGKLISKDRFKVLGRSDYSDIRGCNLLFQ